jgi:hypothetical protein
LILAEKAIEGARPRAARGNDLAAPLMWPAADTDAYRIATVRRRGRSPERESSREDSCSNDNAE